MYTPLVVKNSIKTTSVTSLMAENGINIKDLPQLLDATYAQNIQNYILTGTGQLEKRKGYGKLFDEIAGGFAITMYEKFTDDIHVFAYNTTVAIYTKSTGVVATIKSDFAGTSFEGVRYGDFFFVTNKTDGLWCIDSTLAITDLSAIAPKANQIAIFGARMILGDLDTDDTAIVYSAPDDGTDPPFSLAAAWTTGTLMTNAGQVYYRNGGQVTCISSLGETIIGFGKEGKWGFQITAENIAGVYYKNDDPVFYRHDFGGERGAISTPVGLIYANNKGFWQLTSVGTTNIPFSDQESNLPVLLGDTYFDNIDVTNGSLIYDAKRGYIYLTCAQNSSTNNLVIAMCMTRRVKTISKFTGMNISRWLDDDGTIYGASDAKTILYEMFTGSEDDGSPIATDFYQELSLGSLSSRKTLLGTYTQGFLSPSSVINVKYDIYDTEGKFSIDKLKYEWTTQYTLGTSGGWGSSEWGRSPWGGDVDYANLVPSFDGNNSTIRNCQRVCIHITCSDKYHHVINWLSLRAKEKVNIRRRRMVQL